MEITNVGKIEKITDVREDGQFDCELADGTIILNCKLPIVDAEGKTLAANVGEYINKANAALSEQISATMVAQAEMYETLMTGGTI